MATPPRAPSRRRGPAPALLAAAALPFAALRAAPPQQPGQARPPGEMQARYPAGDAALLKDNLAKRFPPHQLASAEVLAKRGDVALEGGRFFQALDAFRQARWQLPYNAPEV